MASNYKISIVAAQAMLDALVDLVDGGAGAGVCEIRTGSPPATTLTADSGTLLGTCTFSDPAFGAASSADPSVATANSITSDGSADNSGDAGHFRVKTSSGTVVMQGTAGEAADTPDMVFDEKTIVAGGVIAITSVTVTLATQ
jgi:hypothetical protein